MYAYFCGCQLGKAKVTLTRRVCYLATNPSINSELAQARLGGGWSGGGGGTCTVLNADGIVADTVSHGAAATVIISSSEVSSNKQSSQRFPAALPAVQQRQL